MKFNDGVVTTNLVCMRMMAPMSDQTPAVPNPSSPAAVDSDYESIHAAVMETVRGRWFLREYARRNRAADTGTLLIAIGRIESLLQERGEDAAVPAADVTQAPAAVPQGTIGQARDQLSVLHDQLRDIADSLIECGAPSFLTNDLKRRIAELSQIAGQRDEPAEDIAAAESELFDAAPEPKTSSLMPSSPEPLVTEICEPEVIETPEPEATKCAEPRRDPFADIRALSDAEKIALFT